MNKYFIAIQLGIACDTPLNNSILELTFLISDRGIYLNLNKYDHGLVLPYIQFCMLI